MISVSTIMLTGHSTDPLSLRACPGLDPGERVGVRVNAWAMFNNGESLVS